MGHFVQVLVVNVGLLRKKNVSKAKQVLWLAVFLVLELICYSIQWNLRFTEFFCICVLKATAMKHQERHASHPNTDNSR